MTPSAPFVVDRWPRMLTQERPARLAGALYGLTVGHPLRLLAALNVAPVGAYGYDPVGTLRATEAVDVTVW
jgi:hypothetical protein